MPKRKHKLNFTEEELSGKKADKLAEETVKTKHGRKPKKQMKVRKRLDFEENKPKLSEKLRTDEGEYIKELPGKAVANRIRQKTESDSDDNVSVQAVNEGTRQAENTSRTVRTYTRRKNRKVTDESQKQQLNEERAARKQELRLDRENLKERYNSYKSEHPEMKSNPYSRWKQKQDIKNEYYAAKRGSSASASVSSFGDSVKKSAKKATEETKNKVVEYVAEHKGMVVLAVGVVLAIIIGVGVLSSTGTVLVQSTTGGVSLSTYASEDEDMLNAEQAYCQLEANLQSKIDNFESTHSYDEYHYDLDEIGHDPYVLISMLSALHDGEFTADEVESELQTAFNKQYNFSFRVVKETHYRYETRYRYVTVVDADGNTYQTLESYTVRVPYDYYKCYVTLRNNNLSHVPSQMLSEDQLSMYSIYMATLGNREDLFPDSEYIGRYDGEVEHYDIPVSYMGDERFAKMMEEADKYVGYPYVFGGSSPSTSFDCSGYVSWVVNHSDWNFGRLTATQLYYKCTPVSKANAKPGDLIFFEGTYNSGTLCSHVGIIVDPVNKVMVDAGDPIQYESYDTSYWNSHYYSCGRLPNP